MRGRNIDRRSYKVRTASIPAPVGGLNARDAIANMPATDAVLMDNFFPRTSDVVLRNGYTNFATGLPGWVETLMAYRSQNGNASNKLFAASGTAIYDVTAGGAVGSPVVTGLTNARWQYVNFSIVSGQYIYAVNGADKPRLYNGSTWTPIDGSSTPAITGVTTTLLVDVKLFKHRLWFVEKNSFRVWYLPTDSIGGAASSIDFGPLFQRGGYLMTMSGWSVNDSGGMDDYFAFISSEGEVALYRGTDPASAATWALVGLFRLGHPIGRRCVTRLGSDLIMICADGIFPLSKALLSDRNQLQDAVSNKILNLINDDVQSYGKNFGWEPIVYPIGNKLIVNVPKVENNTQYQYVMNTITQSWCRFTGWNAACYELLADNLYFGGKNVVCQADTGSSDNGALITGDIKPAFSYFGAKGRIKRFTQIRPIIQADGNISAAIALNVDFGNTVPTQMPNFSGSGGSPWNSSPWNVTPWGGAAIVQKRWQSVTGLGFAATIRMRISNNKFPVSWQSTDYVYEIGGIL